MTRKLFATLLKIGSVAFLLFVLLFAGGAWQSAPGFIGYFLREITAVLRDAETQWMVLLCLGIYFTAFIFLRARLDNSLAQRPESAKVPGWLVFLLIISAVSYGIHYLPSTPALTLLAGAVIGQGVVFLKSEKWKAETGNGFCALVTFLLVVLLMAASVWNGDSSRSYAYHNHPRWIGPWDNPNLFGLLMGTGAALAAGFGLSRWKMEDGGLKSRSGVWRLASGKLVMVGFCFLAVVLMGRGLLHSYSRGAWLATAVGLGYMLWSWISRLGGRDAKAESRKQKAEMEHLTPASPHTVGYSQQPSTGLRPPSPAPASEGKPSGSGGAVIILFVSWLKINWLTLALIVVAMGAICFWHLRQTNSHPVRRAISAVNLVDFSWRNRVTAWEGDLQMMAEHPWFGIGWSQAEPLYQYFYLPPKLTESGAIQMNDYLMLGATLGVPALFCFGMYLWLTLGGKAEIRNQKAKFSEPDWLQTTCRAGAIVLLVGFWFDGGLLKLPTAATFWILLELGCVINRERREMHEND